MKQNELFYQLKKNNVNFFVGVPDTTLKEFIMALENEVGRIEHIRATNEGEAVAIATGYHLATGKLPCVYLQSDGMTNALSPLTSLVNIYQIPMVLVIGHRGLSGDAIQHKAVGTGLHHLLAVADCFWHKDGYTVEEELKTAKERGQVLAYIFKK